MSDQCPCGEPAGHPDTYHATDVPNPTGSFNHAAAQRKDTDS